MRSSPDHLRESRRGLGISLIVTSRQRPRESVYGPLAAAESAGGRKRTRPSEKKDIASEREKMSE